MPRPDEPDANHNDPPGQRNAAEEPSRADLAREDRAERLEDSVGDEEGENNHRVASPYLQVQVLVQTGDGSSRDVDPIYERNNVEACEYA